MEAVEFLALLPTQPLPAQLDHVPFSHALLDLLIVTVSTATDARRPLLLFPTVDLVARPVDLPLPLQLVHSAPAPLEPVTLTLPTATPNSLTVVKRLFSLPLTVPLVERVVLLTMLFLRVPLVLARFKPVPLDMLTATVLLLTDARLLSILLLTVVPADLPVP